MGIKPKHRVIDGKKICTTCNQNKPVKLFNKDNRLSAGYTAQCKSCRNKQTRKYYWSEQGEEARKKNKENTRNWRYLRDYGITTEDYNKLYQAQKGKCAICGGKQTSGENLDVDHNHKTGEVRGLLCHSCNKGIGLLKDSPRILKLALKYLEERGCYDRYSRK